MDIILASTSVYRRHLLERLLPSFTCIPPNLDETAAPAEGPAALAGRLATQKAQIIAQQNPAALVIGSDQVASLEGELLGKPGTHEVATKQLRACAGKRVEFFTGVTVVCASRGLLLEHVEPFNVRFRALEDHQIENYLSREQPYDCAGSFKVEGLGIALFQALEGRDPSSLEGLPLIALTDLLADAGVNIL